MADAAKLLEPILELHERIRGRVIEACERQATEQLSRVDDDGEGDTTYGVDRVAVDLLVDGLRDLARREPLTLVAEGLPPEGVILPEGARANDSKWRVIIDPIDGTRGLMYQKRSAWILTGVAPDKGASTTLRDVVLAVQTELPLVKQHLCDQLWAVRGQGVKARRLNRLTGVHAPLNLTPSRSDTIAHGFTTVVRFFPGVRDVLAALDDDVVAGVLGPPVPGKAACFEDQYASTGGQLYELMSGHDRFIADLRPLVIPVLARRGLPPGLCCHPYDICTALIALELGVELTDGLGAPLDVPLNLTADVAWAGYANAALRRRIEPVLEAALVKHGLVKARRA